MFEQCLDIYESSLLSVHFWEMKWIESPEKLCMQICTKNFALCNMYGLKLSNVHPHLCAGVRPSASCQAEWADCQTTRTKHNLKGGVQTLADMWLGALQAVNDPKRKARGSNHTHLPKLTLPE
jgi:hypothetical protein